VAKDLPEHNKVAWKRFHPLSGCLNHAGL